MIISTLDKAMKVAGVKTQKELSAKADIPENTISRFRKMGGGGYGRVDTSTLERLCTALDCQPGDLLEYVPEANSE